MSKAEDLTVTQAAAKKTTRKPAANKAGGVSKTEFNNLKSSVSGMQETISEMAEQGQQTLEMISGLSEVISNMAKNNPVTRTGGLESEELHVSNEPEVNFGLSDDSDDADVTIEKSSISDVENPGFEEKMKNIAFMNEPVTVMVHESDDINAAPVIEVAVNGRSEFFVRGQHKTVKRMYVEGLARAKPVKYGNRHQVNPETGIEEVTNRASSGQRYPFNVIQDGNPLGAEWLKSVMAQRA